MKNFIRSVLAVSFVVICSLVHATVPQTVSYQGYLANSGGTPVTASASMTFRLYTAASGGSALWTETQPTVNVSNGVFNVLLGSGTAFSSVPLLFDVPYWLTVQVNADPEMTPRQPLASVPYAFRASALDGLATVPAGQISGALTAATLPAASITGTLSTGQLAINATTQLLPAIACTTNQIPKWNGAAWACAADDTAPSGNLTLADPSTSMTGNVLKGTARFIHNFGIDNTFMGVDAGNFTLTGDANAGFGKFTLRALTTGASNTAVGGGALMFTTTGGNNTAVGTGALNANTIGSSNTAGGTDALTNNISGNQNTAFGHNALNANLGSNNTAYGAFALLNSTSGLQNTAIGALALRFNTTGLSNTAVGWNTLGTNTTGIRNTAVGEASLFANTVGTDNTATGISSLSLNTTGGYNVAMGATALQGNTTGADNTAVGALALTQAVAGTGNTAIGKGALYNSGKIVAATSLVAGGTYTILSTGLSPNNTDFTLIGAANSNVGTTFLATAPGTGLGTALPIANNNIAIGTNAAGSLITGSNNIALGSYITDTESNTMRLGNVQNRTFVAGVRGVQTGFNNAVGVVIDGSGQLGTISSSRTVKDTITDMADASASLMDLRPVTFHYTADRSPSGRTLQYGLIAEEVAAVYPQLVAHSADGRIETVMYQYLPPMLLNEYQKQQRTIAAQAARLSELEVRLARLEALEQEISRIRSRIGE